jgi:hypothetical protein
MRWAANSDYGGDDVADLSPRIPEDEARALWQRAIELQVSAEQAHAGSRRLAPGRMDGLSLDQVVEAAEGAGIDPTYVRLAVAEQRLPDANQMRRDRWTARWARQLLAEVDAIEVTARIQAPPERTIPAFDAVVARPAFQLLLEDRVGPDPPLDGVLVYRIESPSSIATSFHGAMVVADARVVLLTAEDEGDVTLLRLRLPRYEHGVNLALTGGLAGGLGTAGGFGGAAAGSALAGMLGTASAVLVAGPAGIGALAGAAIGVAGFRRLSGWGRRKGESALRRLLQAVAVEAEGRG